MLSLSNPNLSHPTILPYTLCPVIPTYIFAYSNVHAIDEYIELITNYELWL